MRPNNGSSMNSNNMSLSALLRQLRSDPPLMSEVAVRVGLFLFFVATEMKSPFVRVIRKEEAWLYGYPKQDSYVPTSMLWVMVTFVPLGVIAAVQMLGYGGRADKAASALVVTLLMPLNGVVTNCVKLVVGRPRPDFLQRYLLYTRYRLLTISDESI